MPAVMQRARAAKEERVNARLRLDEKDLLARAAYLSGLSMSRFMLTAALREARKLILSEKTYLPSERAIAFGESLLNPPEPAQTAVASFRKARRWPSK